MNIFINYKQYKNVGRIDVSEGIDVNKTDESTDIDICHYWYFSSKGFKFQLHVCTECHDLLMMSLNLRSIAILVELAKLKL